MTQAQTQQNPQALFEQVREYINDAHEICERGEYIELVGLDDRVQQMCEAIQAMTQEEAKTYEQELESLMQKLDGLQEILVQRRDALGEEVSDTNKHQQAARAYANSQMQPSAPAEEE